MPDLTTSADIDAFLAAANDAAARTELGLGALATVTPGTGVAAALAINVGSAGAPVLFNGAGGTPSSLTGTNITGTAAGLTAGTASAVAVGGITGLGTGVGTWLATPSGANLATALTTALPASKGGTGLTSLGTGVATWLGTPSSANLLAAITDETGSGSLVFGTSPTFTTSIVAGGTTIALFNTVATTVNAFGVATTLNIGAGAATVLNFGGFTSAAELRFLEPSGSGTNYSGFKQPALGTSITYLLPSDAPTNGQFLACQADGTLSWETSAGSGDVSGPVSSTDNAIAVWNGTGGDTLEDSSITITGGNTLNADTVATTNLTATSVLPAANDGAALGASGTAFSDLFLASGAVINFNAGNLTLTHSAGVLTSNGAYVGTTGTFGSATSLLVGTAGSAVGSVGFRNATSGTITVAPTTGALRTVTQTLQAVTGTILCTGGTDVPVADGGTGLSSGTSGGILGFTAAGTLASSAALAANAIVIGGGAGATPTTTTTGTGVLTALGVNVGSAGAFVTFNGAGGTPSSITLTNGSGLPASALTAAVLAANITLGEGAGNLLLDQTLSADGTWSGIAVLGTAGYTQAFGDVVYLDPTDSRWEACDANAAAGADGDCRGNIGMVVSAGTDGNSCTILRVGKIRADANFPALTVNNPIYISETAGDITQTQPTTTDVVIRIIGQALTADEMYFCPDNMWITHT